MKKISCGDKVVFKELSYKIVGALFDVYNDLGYGYQEKYYEKAIKEAFIHKKLEFKEQIKFDIVYKGNKIGRYYLDFLVDDKIILEIKKGNFFSRRNIEQVKGYLKATGLKLAILANFTPTGVKFLRILNIKNL